MDMNVSFLTLVKLGLGFGIGMALVPVVVTFCTTFVTGSFALISALLRAKR